MLWLYHAFWWHTLAGMMLIAYGCWSPGVMTQNRIEKLGRLRMPVWLITLFAMMFSMVWSPFVVASLMRDR